MHNLHLVRIKENSHQEACASALSYMEDWGTENNWRCAGGSICEDGTKENYDDYARWPAVYDGEAWEPTVKNINQMCKNTLSGEKFTVTLLDAIERVFNTRAVDLVNTSNNWSHLYAVKQYMNFLNSSEAARKLRDTYDIFTSPGFYEYQYGEFGLTDMSDEEEGDKTYIVLIDMHT